MLKLPLWESWRPLAPLPKKMRVEYFFALVGALLWKTLVGKAIREKCSLILGEKEVIRGLVVSIHLKENLPVVNINYLLMAYNFKGKFSNLL